MAVSVVIFAFPGVKALDVVAPNEVFTHAAHLTDGGYEITIASISGGLITAESGLTLPTKAMPEPTTIDTLVLPGGSGVHSARSDSTMTSWIRTASSRARRTVAVGTGALLVAEAGVLDGNRAPTLPAIAGDSVLLRSSPTARAIAGGAGGIDTALAVVGEDFGTEVANEVARLVHYQPGAGAPAPSRFAPPVWTPRATHDAVRQAQDAIEADPGAKHTVSELARRAAMSPRHFSRVFITDVGETPGAYVERARLELARRKLEETADTVVAIAARCGFGTAETMRRTFTRRIGISPTEYRKRLDRHRVPAAESARMSGEAPQIRTDVPRIPTCVPAAVSTTKVRT